MLPLGRIPPRLSGCIRGAALSCTHLVSERTWCLLLMVTLIPPREGKKKNQFLNAKAFKVLLKEIKKFEMIESY